MPLSPRANTLMSSENSDSSESKVESPVLSASSPKPIEDAPMTEIVQE